MGLDYIRRYYSVPAKRGARVAYTYRGYRLGTIVGSVGPRLRIRLDGERYSRVLHPTWEIDYSPDAAQVAEAVLAQEAEEVGP